MKLLNIYTLILHLILKNPFCEITDIILQDRLDLIKNSWIDDCHAPWYGKRRLYT